MAAEILPLYRPPDAFKPSSAGVASPLELDGLLGEALVRLNAHGVAFAQEIAGEISCTATCGSNVPGVGATLDPNSGLCSRCVREGKEFLCEDANLDPEVDQAAARRINVRSIAVAPLRIRSSTIGVLAAFHAEPNRFQNADILTLCRLAEQATALLSGEQQPEDSSLTSVESGPSAVPETGFSFTVWDSGFWQKPQVIGIAGLAIILIAVASFQAFHNSLPIRQRTIVTSAGLNAAAGNVLGQNVTKSAGPSDSVSDLMKRAKAGDADAQVLVAKDFEIGNGVSQDLVKANTWYILASINGIGPAKASATAMAARMTPLEIGMARFNVGNMFLKGTAVPTDFIAAFSWFELAKAAGDIRAEVEEAKLAAIMSPMEITEARNRAAAWLHAHHRKQTK
jgi:hypothetical protein